jgi:hypothetical protein
MHCWPPQFNQVGCTRGQKAQHVMQLEGKHLSHDGRRPQAEYEEVLHNDIHSSIFQGFLHKFIAGIRA